MLSSKQDLNQPFTSSFEESIRQSRAVFRYGRSNDQARSLDSQFMINSEHTMPMMETTIR